MLVRQILTSSVALLLTHAAWAETNPAGAEPVTVAASAGNEQSDFFISQSGLNVRVVFSSLVRQVSKNGAVVSDQRAFFQQKIQALTGNGITEYFAESKAAPLTKITTFTVPPGTKFDGFVYNADGDATSPPAEEFFHVPTKGIYVIKNGTAISAIRAETAAAPATTGALKDLGNKYNDSDHATQSRYVFGAKVPNKGYEPLAAASSAKDTIVLKDIETARNVGSNPFDFSTFNDSVYFLTKPDAGAKTLPALWHLTVDTKTGTPKYSAAIVAAENGLTDPHLASDASDLYLSTKAGTDSFHSLFVSTDGVTYTKVTGGGVDATDITANIQPNLDGTGYSSLDGVTRRFTEFSSINNESFFTDATGAVTNPVLITSTGNYFYYGANYQGVSYVIRDFTGGNGGSNLTGGDSPDALTDKDGNYLTTLKEIVFVHNPDPSDPDTSTGELYFTADVTRNGVTSTGLLFEFDPNSDNDVATTVKTNKTGAEVVGAHNLRRVANGQNFRLYFCAPVNNTANSDARPEDAKGNEIAGDYGTKPWVFAPL